MHDLSLSCSCQIMYAIRTRNGNVYMKIKRNFGDMSALNVSFVQQNAELHCRSPLLLLIAGLLQTAALTPPSPPPLQDDESDGAEKMMKKERNGGNYGSGTKEIQERNYIARKENERKRRELFDDALAKFKGGDVAVSSASEFHPG